MEQTEDLEEIKKGTRRRSSGVTHLATNSKRDPAVRNGHGHVGDNIMGRPPRDPSNQ